MLFIKNNKSLNYYLLNNSFVVYFVYVSFWELTDFFVLQISKEEKSTKPSNSTHPVGKDIPVVDLSDDELVCAEYVAKFVKTIVFFYNNVSLAYIQDFTFNTQGKTISNQDGVVVKKKTFFSTVSPMMKTCYLYPRRIHKKSMLKREKKWYGII